MEREIGRGRQGETSSRCRYAGRGIARVADAARSRRGQVVAGNVVIIHAAMADPAGDSHFPPYLAVSAEALGEGSGVKVCIVEDSSALASCMAEAIFAELTAAAAAERHATLIVPVGPVDQYPPLAAMINEQGIDCRGTMLIAMDEYLDNADQWVDLDHPLSFRGFLNRKFYDLVDKKLAPKMENRVVPDPADPGAVGRRIAERGGVDAVFGGIGINGHIAFNEPEDDISPQRFALLPTRTLEITPHTRTINAHTVGGEIGIIPRRAITVGMKEILGARRLRFFCNRPWQRAVVRRVLHGSITPSCPASFLRTHPDSALTMARYVAEPPEICLR